MGRTERFYDLTGALTYISVTALALALSESGLRHFLLAAVIVIWALRLGTFLFLRVGKSGDDRFDELKENGLEFFLTWALQGLWVALTASAAWIAMSSPH